MSKRTDQEMLFQTIYDEAVRRGHEAGNACEPVPMTVQRHANPLDDASPVTQSWHVPEGLCGFAWVVVRPGTSSFARWLVKQGHAKPAYEGGVQIWVSEHNQSHARKCAHASEMANYLRSIGIRAYFNDRLD